MAPAQEAEVAEDRDYCGEHTKDRAVLARVNDVLEIMVDEPAVVGTATTPALERLLEAGQRAREADGDRPDTPRQRREVGP